MKNAAGLLLMTLALAAAGSVQAKDSDTAAKLQPRGSSGSSGSAPLASPPGAGQAAANSIGESRDAGDPPKASREPPLSASTGTQSSVGGGNVFRFRVCNKSDTGALVAVTRRDDSGSGWRVEGWWRVDPAQCSNIGTFPRGWVYYYADAEDGGSWGGDTLRKCVKYPGPFSRYEEGGGGGYECRRDERLKGFNGWLVEADVGQHTWNLNP